MDASSALPPRDRWGPPLAVAIAVIAAFFPVLSAGFVNYDDPVNFLRNPHFRGFSGDNLAWMFTNMYGHYMPLTWLTHALDYEIWGMEPFGYHLMNLLLHAANALLFHGVLLLLLPGKGARERWVAAAGALLFAIHPMRVESVAWVTERRDVLGGLFFLLSVRFYLRAEAGERRKRLALSVLFFACSLLSKTTGMALPVVLLALDAWVLRRRTLLEKIPYFILSAIAAVLTLVAQRAAGALHSMEQYPLLASLLQPGFRACWYVMKLCLPFGLTPVHLLESRADGLALAPFGIVFAAFTVVLFRSKRPLPLVSWVSFVALLSPVLGTLQAGPHFAADRYTYLPSLALAALGAAALLRWPRVAAPAALLVLVMGVLTWRQSRVWHDSFALWNHALEVNPRNHVALNNRGMARLSGGDPKGAKEDLEACLSLRPVYPPALAGLGLASHRLGDRETARAQYDASLRAAPGSAATHVLRAALRRETGDPDGARADYDEAIRLEPDRYEALYGRAMLRKSGGDMPGAIEDCERALAIHPGYAPAWFGSGQLRVLLGDRDGALEDFSTAIRWNRDFGAAWLDRGTLRQRRGDLDGALIDYGEAIRCDPASSGARFNRALLLGGRGDLEGAIADLDEVIRRDGRDFVALRQRGLTFVAKRAWKAATADLEAALRAAPQEWKERPLVEKELEEARKRAKENP